MSTDSLDTEPASETPQSRPIAFAVFSVVAGAIGWFAAFELMTEYIHTLREPGYVPNCAISLLVTCGPNMGSWQGAVFGFSNSIIGLAAWTAPIIVGVALLAGARFKAWFWWLYQLGLLGGLVFVHWLAYQSIFDIHTLCPWCMVTWAVMIPLFWVSIFMIPASGWSGVSPRLQRLGVALLRWAWVIAVLDILLIAFVAQLQLDWFAEFRRL